MRKVLVVLIVAVITILIFTFASILATNYRANEYSNIKEKIYVALEEEGKIAVVNTATKKVIKKISLTMQDDGGILGKSPDASNG